MVFELGMRRGIVRSRVVGIGVMGGSWGRGCSGEGFSGLGRGVCEVCEEGGIFRKMLYWLGVRRRRGGVGRCLSLFLVFCVVF